MGKLPTDMHKFQPNLKYLHLNYEQPSAEDPMPLLEKFPSLTILGLVRYEENKLACTTGGFPQLLIQQLLGCEPEELQVEGGMPVLNGFEGSS